MPNTPRLSPKIQLVKIRFGGKHYHRDGCMMLPGNRYFPIPIRLAIALDYHPCPGCNPPHTQNVTAA